MWNRYKIAIAILLYILYTDYLFYTCRLKMNNKNIFLTLVTVLICSCSTFEKMPPPITNNHGFITVNVMGLKHHIIYPNDVLLLEIYKGEMRDDNKIIAGERFTDDHLSKKFVVDSDQLFIFTFKSVEANFGGYTSCSVWVRAKPKKNEHIRINYKTRKYSCNAVVMKASNGKSFHVTKQIKGNLGSIQVRTTTVVY